MVGIGLRHIIIGLVVLAVATVGWFGFYQKTDKDTAVITTFEECINAGYAVMESYPRKCRDDAGNTFTEHIGNELEVRDLIRLNTPRPNAEIESPLALEGEARGYWFFEAVAPVVLTDWDGLIIAEGFITAEGEWMTEDFVSFSGDLKFVKPDYGERGSLILKKANPSGLSENDNALEIPIYFK